MKTQKSNMAQSASGEELSDNENVVQNVKDDETLKSFIIEIPGNACFIFHAFSSMQS